MTALLLAAGLTAAADPVVGYGGLSAPAFDLYHPPTPAAEPWDPRAGDVVLSLTDRPRVVLMYAFAFTGRPDHAGLVVDLPDGRPGLLEAGREGDLRYTRLTPLCDRLRQYPSAVWVRRRADPLTPEQSARLTAFAVDAEGGQYAFGRGVAQGLGLFRTRGPVRTFFVGKPRGPGHRYFCGEAVVEAVAFAGAVHADLARPSAIYPRDLFFDVSTNPHLARHPPLAGWLPPARWWPQPPGPTGVGYVPQGLTLARPGTPSPDTLAGSPPHLSWVPPPTEGLDMPRAVGR